MINKFDGEYDFLSNFYISPIIQDNLVFPSVEHAYQAAKSKDPNHTLEILKCITPGKAKRLGKKVKLRPNWEDIKLDIMLELLRIKFRNPILKRKLLNTEDEELIEGNTWGDKYWGMSWNEDMTVLDGLNHLGRLLMKVREEMK